MRKKPDKYYAAMAYACTSIRIQNRGLMTISEAAKYAGRSDTVIRNWINRDKISSCKINGRPYVSRSSIDEYLKVAVPV